MSGPAHAALLGEWTFNTGTSTTQRLESTNNAAGVTVSGLGFNDSFDDFGPGAIPNNANDGIGFGGGIGGAQVMFLHRANYFDGGAPSGLWTSFGNPGNANGNAGTGADLSSDPNAPFAFSITAGANETITVESLSIQIANTTGVIFYFQEAGASPGSAVTLNAGNQSDNANLTTPVVIGPGQTKTFTINVNSGNLNSIHQLDNLAVNGTVIPEPGSIGLLALGGLCVLRRRRRA
ncbi:MAG: PEP-CTERM sorting domain-containing protein [Planctomycetota bacterium]